MSKKVVVLVLSYNGKHLLKDCISTYLSNEYGNFKVVVIDNGSSDGSREWIESNYPGVAILRTENNLGYSGGFNLGLEYAFKKQKADYVLISNNDVKADANAISELVKIADLDDKIGFVTGKVYYFDQPDILQTVGKKLDSIRWNGGQIGRNEKDLGQYDRVEERHFTDDIFMLVSRKLYEDVGGYDNSLFLQCEEFDWQARAKSSGFRIVFTPHAKIWHKVSMTIGKSSPLKAFYDARNPMIVIMKYRSRSFFRRYFWLHLKKDVFAASIRVTLKNLDVRKAIKIWSGFFSALRWGFSQKKLTIRHFL